MKQKFQINGIGCGGCVARVKKNLESHTSIDKVDIALIPRGATVIAMNEALSVEELQEQLDELIGYTITAIN